MGVRYVYGIYINGFDIRAQVNSTYIARSTYMSSSTHMSRSAHMSCFYGDFQKLRVMTHAVVYDSKNCDWEQRQYFRLLLSL